MSKKFLFPLFGWCALGFKRGSDEYDYNFNEYNKNGEKKTYLYSTKIALGLVGCVFYINPFCLPITVTREIYRLEVNLRDLEEEKKSDRYNSLY